MVHSRLHIICGNCGCNNMLEYEIDLKGEDVSTDEEEKYEPVCYISCRNCSTLHNIGDFLKKRKENE